MNKPAAVIPHGCNPKESIEYRPIPTNDLDLYFDRVAGAHEALNAVVIRRTRLHRHELPDLDPADHLFFARHSGAGKLGVIYSQNRPERIDAVVPARSIFVEVLQVQDNALLGVHSTGSQCSISYARYALCR